MNQRRQGNPRSDIERAMSHYGISGQEYLRRPEYYPLPERGYGLRLALEEIADIVEAGFGSLSALTVYGGDPLTAAITVKNNALPPAAEQMVGFLLGTHDPATNTFSCLGITVDGVLYLVGSVVLGTMPSAGASKTISVPTYAVNVSQVITLSAFAFVMPQPNQLRGIGVDWGSGQRTVGINKDDFFAAQGNISAAKIFTDAVTISPPAAPAELTAFSLAKL